MNLTCEFTYSNNIALAQLLALSSLANEIVTTQRDDTLR